MIAVKRVTSYPPPDVVDPSIEGVISHVLSNQKTNAQRTNKIQTLFVFRVFLDIIDQKLSSQNLENKLIELLEPFYGFCYSEIPYKPKTIRSLLNTFHKTVSEIYFEMGLNFTQPMIGTSDKDRQTVICAYKEYKIDKVRLAYYEGWETPSKDGYSIFWHLHGFYNAYGPKLTEQLWKTIKRQCYKEKGSTAHRTSSTLNIILTHIIELCPTRKELNLAGKSLHINDFIVNLYCARLLEITTRGLCTKSFHLSWSTYLKIIQRYIINSGIWSEPAYELFCPPYHSSSTHAGTHERLDQKGNSFNDKLVTNIPLSFSDDDAINSLLISIQSDINHVVTLCQQLVDKIKYSAVKRKTHAAKGKIKPFIRGNCYHPRKDDSDYVDMSFSENQCATWEYYGYDYPGRTLTDFLQLRGKHKQFATDYGVLCNDTLYPFLYLLVNEHPIITESWLLNFELFNKHGKQIGFRQSGTTWIATSIKPRRGSAKAQQTITLNDVSKSLLDDLIELTAKERHWLQAQGKDDWRYLLLTKAKPFSAPSKCKRLHPVSDNSLKNSQLITALSTSTETIDCDKALSICKNLSLTTFRASCGVQVYLNTHSVKAMSEALGHNKYNPRLLSSYLPEPILRFFQDRWVRVFQNAIIYEAMKDSENLFDAVDFNAEELDEFLRNHRLKPLPTHLITGQVSDLTENIESSDEVLDGNAIIPVSAPILRVLNGIIELIDSANDHVINPIAVQWYETARFVTDTIETNCSCPKITQAMNYAKANPLPLERLKEATYVTT